MNKLSQFDQIAEAIVNYIDSRGEPIRMSELLKYFENMPIDAGRVTLELMADRVLYFTEDRKVAISKRSHNK